MFAQKESDMSEKKTTKVQKDPTPGAGVDPKKVVNGTNRLKRLWRGQKTKLSFRAFVRETSRTSEKQAEGWDYKQYALDLLFRKSAAFTAEARKARKDRVRAAQAASKSNRPADGKNKGKKK